MNPGSRLALSACFLVVFALSAPPARAQDGAPPPPAPAASGNALNPNLSVICWLQANVGSRRVTDPAMELREAEIGLQADVDPYARADFFMSVAGDGGLDLEEGYLTLTQLPAGLGLKLGKFRNRFGKFNMTHAGETPFADRPLATEALFGGEGLSSTGVSASYLAPLPFYASLDVEVTVPPTGESGGIFARTERRGDLLYIGRAAAFLDLDDATNVNLSASVADGPTGPEATGGLAGSDSRAQVFGGELTVRWKRPARAIYRSFTWQAEGYLARATESAAHAYPDLPAPGKVTRRGLFTYADYQFARRWHVGARFDYAQTFASTGHQTGQLGFLTFTPSEFSLVSAQVRRVRTASGTDDWNGFLKVTFNIGPHGAHPF
ncbi:MAG: hypothetical protein HZB25_04205 [Candidatus Eisenbacteria bacterium]|nr:hypothetical protein [Candidatus Eisenbacteria bacterium]